MPITIRPATAADTPHVSAILTEAAQWLAQSGQVMWRDNELLPGRLAADVSADLFFLAEQDSVPAGIVRFQFEDPLFWPDQPTGESAYVHRLAVRREFAGRGISQALLTWAVDRTRSLNRRYLRLDCEASRPKLRAVYECFGFRHHSDRQVGPYYVARYQYEIVP